MLFICHSFVFCFRCPCFLCLYSFMFMCLLNWSFILLSKSCPFRKLLETLSLIKKREISNNCTDHRIVVVVVAAEMPLFLTQVCFCCSLKFMSISLCLFFIFLSFPFVSFVLICLPLFLLFLWRLFYALAHTCSVIMLLRLLVWIRSQPIQYNPNPNFLIIACSFVLLNVLYDHVLVFMFLWLFCFTFPFCRSCVFDNWHMGSTSKIWIIAAIFAFFTIIVWSFFTFCWQSSTFHFQRENISRKEGLNATDKKKSVEFFYLLLLFFLYHASSVI